METFDGEPCYPSLKALPESPGGALIMVAPAQAEGVVEDAAAAGIKRVWMQQGAESEAAIKFCQANGISEVHWRGASRRLPSRRSSITKPAPLGLGHDRQAAKVSEQQNALTQDDDMRRQQNRELLARLNAAYAEGLTPAEQALLRESRESYARLLEDEAAIGQE